MKKSKNRNLRQKLKISNIRADYNKEMKEKYQSLFDTSVSELRFKNMKVDFLLNALNEVEVLCGKGVNQKIIKQVIKNAKERNDIDTIIHNHLILK